MNQTTRHGIPCYISAFRECTLANILMAHCQSKGRTLIKRVSGLRKRPVILPPQAKPAFPNLLVSIVCQTRLPNLLVNINLSNGYQRTKRSNLHQMHDHGITGAVVPPLGKHDLVAPLRLLADDRVHRAAGPRTGGRWPYPM